MFNCPHCDNPGIPNLLKAILSPGLRATCKICGKLSSIRYASWLAAMTPGSILMLAALFVGAEWLEWFLNVVGVVLMIAFPYLFTPLRQAPEYPAQSDRIDRTAD